MLSGVTIRLDTGLSVSGTVIDPAGNPVSAAKVMVRRITGDDVTALMARVMPGFVPEGTVSTVTDDAGAFLFEHLAGETYEAWSSHPDLCNSERITLELTGSVKNLVLQLREGGTLSVTVRRDGKGVPGALLQLMGSSSPKMGPTDLEGKAVFKHLEPHDYVLQAVIMRKAMSGNPLSGVKQFVVTIEEGKTTEQEIRLGEGVDVSGSITGITGETGPVMAAVRKPDAPGMVMGMPQDFGAAVESTRYNVGFTMIQKDGAFSVEDIPPGRYKLQVYTLKDASSMSAPAEGYRPIWEQEITVSKTASPAVTIEL
jgi:hypothetical protein